MLGDLFRSGRLRPGERILCIVPESGRFLFGYVALRVVGPEARQGTPEPFDAVSLPAGRPALAWLSPVRRCRCEAFSPDTRTMLRDSRPTSKPVERAIEEALVRQLAQVWTDFENRLHHVPIVAKMEAGRMTVQDYRDLLFNLRQQVIDGSRWISRVASNITREHFPLRSAFIGHSADEHRDFEMIERDYTPRSAAIERRSAPASKTSAARPFLNIS